MRMSSKPLISLAMAGVLFAAPSFAFDTPLSDQAVREAYFLGQRHDETMATFLNKYTKFLSSPKTGPYIASVSFLTPFALMIKESNGHGGTGYSAQQAALYHRNHPEVLRIVVQILFTQSYASVIPRPTGSRSDSAVGFQLRPSDFWRDFKIQIYDRDNLLQTDPPTGEPLYICDESSCVLTGANVMFELPADAFTSDTAGVDVTPPVGDPVSVDFDLDHLR
jgi:hypothetical protein